MNGTVFTDASAWIAIINRQDDCHFAARELYRKLLAEKTPLFTTTWAAYEALTLVKNRMGYKKMAELWKVLNNPRMVKLVRVNRVIEEAGLNIFFGYTFYPRHCFLTVTQS